MAYFDTCPRCGAHNDPGKKCDCSKKLIFDRYDYMYKRGTVKASNHRGGRGKAIGRIAVYRLF